MPTIVRLAMEQQAPVQPVIDEWQAIVNRDGPYATFGERHIRPFTEVRGEFADAYRAGTLTP